MEYERKNCSDIQICYIGGGSQGWAWKLMSDLYLEEALSGTIRLYDIDMDAAKANEAIGNRLFAYEGAKSKWNFVTASSLEEGLKGADFVIISILPATFEEMRSDVHAPEEYGIYQSVGDTVGPGGLFRALRTIPMYEVIANAIKEYCPKHGLSTIPILCPSAQARSIRYFPISRRSDAAMRYLAHRGFC